MEYVKAFIFGGMLCVIGQVLIDKTISFRGKNGLSDYDKENKMPEGETSGIGLTVN